MPSEQSVEVMNIIAGNDAVVAPQSVSYRVFFKNLSYFDIIILKVSLSKVHYSYAS